MVPSNPPVARAWPSGAKASADREAANGVPALTVRLVAADKSPVTLSVPPERVHAYVSPACEGTDAWRPVVPVMADVGAVIDTTGVATSVTLAVALAEPTALVTVHPSATGPGGSATATAECRTSGDRTSRWL